MCFCMLCFVLVGAVVEKKSLEHQDVLNIVSNLVLDGIPDLTLPATCILEEIADAKGAYLLLQFAGWHQRLVLFSNYHSALCTKQWKLQLRARAA